MNTNDELKAKAIILRSLNIFDYIWQPDIYNKNIQISSLINGIEWIYNPGETF